MQGPSAGRGGSATEASPVAGPDAVQVHPRHLDLGSGCAATLAVTGYPCEVGPGWLEPLLTWPGRLDVAVHVEPIPPAVAADRLRKQRARLESERRIGADRGRLDDPEAEAAAADARELAYAVARGEGRLFRVGVYLTVHAAAEDALAAEVAAVRALAESLLLRVQPVTYRQLQGWITTLPLGLDLIKTRRTLDTAALAAAFPFTSSDLPAADPTSPAPPSGVLWGVNTSSAGLVLWDRWSQPNYNSVVLARSGAGKSYLAKLDLLRSLFAGVTGYVIDPEDEYAPLAQAVGGTYLHLGAPGMRLNPFDLPAPSPVSSTVSATVSSTAWSAAASSGASSDASSDKAGSTSVRGEDVLTRRALFAHTFLAVLLGERINPAGRAALDRAIMAAYRGAGITGDPRSWARPAPLLTDLAAALRADPDPAAADLAARLMPFTEGTHRHLFDGPTTHRPDGHLVVVSLRDLPDELRAAGTLLTLDAIWRHVTNPADRRPRLVVVDEAWLLMRDPDGAKYLHRLAKTSRRHWAGLALVTQDAADVLGTELGQAIVANSATQILLAQAPQAIGPVAAAFGLSAGERHLLLTAGEGEGLLAAGPNSRVSFRGLASPTEHNLITTKPTELAELAARGGIDAWPEPDGETLSWPDGAAAGWPDGPSQRQAAA